MSKMSLAAYFMGVLISVILGVAVVIPIVKNVTAEAGLSGTDGTIAGILSTLILLVIVMLIVKAVN
jgi:hypothetical protein